MKKCKHANLVKLEQIFESDNNIYMILEYCN